MDMIKQPADLEMLRKTSFGLQGLSGMSSGEEVRGKGVKEREWRESLLSHEERNCGRVTY